MPTCTRNLRYCSALLGIVVLAALLPPTVALGSQPPPPQVIDKAPAELKLQAKGGIIYGSKGDAVFNLYPEDEVESKSVTEVRQAQRGARDRPQQHRVTEVQCQIDDVVAGRIQFSEMIVERERQVYERSGRGWQLGRRI